jgi:DNA-binding transcriptional LysR family regulator
MQVTLNQLKAFDWVVKLGSFHAAARELRLSQPSVSQRIRELEDALGTSLFTRRGPRISLTAEGHALIEYVDRLLSATSEMVERVRTRDPLRGMLRFGMNESFAFVCLPDLLHRLEHRYPGIKTSVSVGDTGTVSRMLDEQELDLAVVSNPSIGSHIRQEPIGKNRLGWFASTNFRGTRGRLTPADLCKFHLIISPPTARLHGTAMRWFADAGATPQRMSTCNSLSVTISTILNNSAIGLVPIRIMQDEIARRRVRRIRVSPEVPAHHVSICYQTHEFGPSLKALVDLTRELIEEHKLFV